MVTGVDYGYGCQTDHYLVSMAIDIKTIKRGKGVWKLNNKHLANSSFCDSITNSIKMTTNLCKKIKCDEIETWEMVKSKCIQTAQKWSKNHAKGKRSLLTNLYRLITSGHLRFWVLTTKF